MDNQRKTVRTPLKVRLRIEHPQHGELMVMTRDISDSGVYVLLEQSGLLAVGDRYEAMIAADKAAQNVVRDASGNELADGDSVVLIKDLKVKGAGQTLKQGTVIRTIRLTDNPEEIDCRHDAIRGLVLRTEFVRKR